MDCCKECCTNRKDCELKSKKAEMCKERRTLSSGFGCVNRYLNGFTKECMDLEGAAEYDFKNELKVYCLNMKKKIANKEAKLKKARKMICDMIEKNSLDRILQFKGKEFRNSVCFECDGTDGKCSLILDIYNKLWGFEILSSNSFGSIDGELNFRVGGDTMNSFKTTYNEHKKSKMVNGELYDFASNTHAVGNFVLVPAYFNASRGKKNGKIRDYWDLSLNYLRHFGFRCIDHEIQEPTFEPKHFSEYINTFFLWDYVYVDNGEYKIKSLFIEPEKFAGDDSSKYIYKGGVYDGLREKGKGALPKGAEITNFLNNVNWAIRRRGIFMVAMLKLQEMVGDNVYKSIQDKVFGKNMLEEKGLYSSYQCVFKALIEALIEAIGVKKDSKEESMLINAYALIIDKSIDEARAAIIG